MKERPILFSGEMVRAILDGRKTVTRRVVKPQPHEATTFFGELVARGKMSFHAMMGNPKDSDEWYCAPKSKQEFCPYGQPGDRLWVREQIYNNDGDWAYSSPPSGWVPVGPDGWSEKVAHKGVIPSIHMPRWASRITLEVTGVRVERVQDITDEEVKREGLNEDLVPVVKTSDIVFPDTQPQRFVNWRGGFQKLWDSINASRGFGWDKNPWVWVAEFKKV